MNPLHLIADAATQPALYEVWSPEKVIQLIAALVAGILSIVAVLKSRENSARLNRQNERQNLQERDQKVIALHTPVPQRPDTPHDPPTVGRSPLLLLPLLMLPFLAGGCLANGQPMSAATRLKLASQTYTELANFTAGLMERGVISDQKTKDLIVAASDEADAGLDDAEASLAAGNFKLFDTVLARVQSALDRLAVVKAKHSPRSAGARSDAWTRPRSSPLFSPQRSPLRSSPTPSAAPTLAKSRPMRTWPPSAPSARLPLPA